MSMQFPKILNNDGAGSMILKDGDKPVAEMLARTSDERDAMAAEFIRRWNAFADGGTVARLRAEKSEANRLVGDYMARLDIEKIEHEQTRAELEEAEQCILATRQISVDAFAPIRAILGLDDKENLQGACTRIMSELTQTRKALADSNQWLAHFKNHFGPDEIANDGPIAHLIKENASILASGKAAQ